MRGLVGGVALSAALAVPGSAGASSAAAASAGGVPSVAVEPWLLLLAVGSR
jgi:hypothetical protein